MVIEMGVIGGALAEEGGRVKAASLVAR
jgi:hypothetical protein